MREKLRCYAVFRTAYVVQPPGTEGCSARAESIQKETLGERNNEALKDRMAAARFGR